MTSSHTTRIQEQFGGSAEEYVTSPDHASGDDLDTIRSWFEGGPDLRALDIATGGGHTALAAADAYGHVVATDVTPAMLEAAGRHILDLGFTNVEFVTADAEALPFEDASFDCVTCRIAAHHFADPGRFVGEAFRVLRPVGLFLLEDTIAPAGEAPAQAINQIEKLRDSTHVRNLSRTEWVNLLQSAGFVIEAEVIDRKRHELSSWMDRSRTPVRVRTEIQRVIKSTGDWGIEAFAFEFHDGACIAFTDLKLLLKARRPLG